MTVLHIDSGILGDHSVSRRLTAAVAAQIKAEQPRATDTYRAVAWDEAFAELHRLVGEFRTDA